MSISILLYQKLVSIIILEDFFPKWLSEIYQHVGKIYFQAILKYTEILKHLFPWLDKKIIDFREHKTYPFEHLDASYNETITQMRDKSHALELYHPRYKSYLSQLILNKLLNCSELCFLLHKIGIFLPSCYVDKT